MKNILKNEKKSLDNYRRLLDLNIIKINELKNKYPINLEIEAYEKSVVSG